MPNPITESRFGFGFRRAIRRTMPLSMRWQTFPMYPPSIFLFFLLLKSLISTATTRMSKRLRAGLTARLRAALGPAFQSCVVRFKNLVGRQPCCVRGMNDMVLLFGVSRNRKKDGWNRGFPRMRLINTDYL